MASRKSHNAQLWASLFNLIPAGSKTPIYNEARKTIPNEMRRIVFPVNNPYALSKLRNQVVYVPYGTYSRYTAPHIHNTHRTSLMGRRSVGNHEPRRMFSFSLNKLQKEADDNPQDEQKQVEYLKYLNKDDPVMVVKRYESKLFVETPATTEQYLLAVKALGGLSKGESDVVIEQQLDRARAQQLISSGGVAQPNVTQSSASQGLPNANPQAFNAAPGAAGPVPSGSAAAMWQSMLGNNKPVPVRIFGSWRSTALSFLMPIWVIALVYFALKYFSDGDSQGGLSSLLDIPNNHDRVMVVETRFADVKGCDEAKAELQEVVEYLSNPQKFTDIGAQLPKGLLLVGEPGTGKTLLARAIAGEANVPFFFISGSAFDEVFVGVGSKRVRSLFADAKKNSPCIIFIDEIDAVGGKRKQYGNNDGTLQMLLTELDGFEKNEGVIVIAATNIPDSLDPALTRPGRFDKQVAVPVPDVKGRKDIIDLYLSKIKIHADVDSSRIARGTPGFTGADLNQLVNLAAIKAVIQGGNIVTRSIIEETRDDIWMGRMRKSAAPDEKTRKMTAYHEGGHALVSLLTPGCDPIHKITIIQRGHALGMVTHLPEGDQLSLSRKQMMAKLAVALAGRAAEEVVYGHNEVTSGASSDFQTASNLAFNMVSKWGMSDKVGLVHYNMDKRSASQETLRTIDEEVKSLLEKQYEAARQCLINNRDKLDKLVTLLLDKETLTGEEVKEMFGVSEEHTEPLSM